MSSQANFAISSNNCAGLTPFVVKVDAATVGDKSYTFPTPFRSTPVVAAVSFSVPGLTGNTTVAAMVDAWVKSISTTAITVSVGSGGTLTSGEVIVLLFGEV